MKERRNQSVFADTSSVENLFSVDSKLVINLKAKHNIYKIVETTKVIEKWAHIYDFNKNRCNGYRSLVKIASSFVRLVVDECKHHGLSKINDSNLVNMSTVLVNCLQTAIKMNEDAGIKYEANNESLPCVLYNNHIYGEIEDVSLFNNRDTFVSEILCLMKQLEQSMDSLNSQYAYFWLDKRINFCNQILLLLLAMYATPAKLWFSIITDKSCRQQAVQYAINHQTIHFLTSFWSFPKYFFIEKISRSFFHFTSGVTTKKILVLRQAKWAIDSLSCEVRKQHLNDYGYIDINRSKVRCILFTKRDCENNEYILLHCRGGLADTPDSHQPYITEWVDKMHSIPVLSINYTSLTEGSLSLALQEILDVYVWLISNHYSVRQKLGFKPQKIILCGHGIGGYLLMLLTFILNDIQILINESAGSPKISIQMPTAIMCISTQFVYKIIMSPSRLISLLDPLRNIPSICSISEILVKNIVTSKNLRVQNIERNMFQRVLNILQNVRRKGVFHIFTDVSNKLLNVAEFLFLRFDKSPIKKCKNNWLNDDIQEVQSEISDFVNAGISPIFHRDFNAVANIPLYLMTSQFDYALDDNITMAKHWKGPVKLECFNGLPNSFLRYYYISDDAKNASNKCLHHLIEAFGETHTNPKSTDEFGFIHFIRILIENLMYS